MGGGEGVRRGGERESIYLSVHCHHQNDFYIKMGSDESHFNVSVGSDGQSYKTVSTNHNLFEEKGEPKRYRTGSLAKSFREQVDFQMAAERRQGICFPDCLWQLGHSRVREQMGEKL